MSDQYDIREDEEQSVKLQEIIDLLLAAGYFRARIKGLSAFDKVVGGMIWCMDSCNVDVNVNLLFQENSTIGQKIALTEKIVMVLPKMECPHALEPHQIQGLDFIHVFPVIQWLVKRSVKVREEKRDFIRAHAVREFDKNYAIREPIDASLVNANKIVDVYRRRRMFKRTDDPPEEESLRVESTLMEYGFRGEQGIEATREAMPLPSDFTATKEVGDTVSAKLVSNIVTTQVQKIAQVSQQFAKLQLDVENSGTQIMQKQQEMMLEKKTSLQQQKTELESDIEASSERLNKIRETVKTLESSHSSGQDENDFRIYKKLQSLLLLEDNLKKQQEQFKDHCKTEFERLQQLVREAAERNSSQENSEAANQSDEERERVQTLRLQLAKKNRSIAFLQRQLDEVPGRGELAQYQRRFLELYNQVAQKHEETKQFYTMYNTLDDTKLYLGKELSLLNSVLDNYSKAMSNALDKEEFMSQFESIVAAIKQNKQKVEKRRGGERNRRDRLSKQLLDLVEQQRNYFAVVRQLTIECKRNEALLANFRGQN